MQGSEMELLFLSLLLLLTLLLALSLRLLSLVPKTSRHHTTTAPLPPGSTGFPIIGETLAFLSAGRHGSPEQFFRDRMAKFSGDIFRTSLLGEAMAVLCGPAGNKFIFSNENKLVTSWWPRSVEKIFPSSLQTSTKEESLKMRKLLPSFLKPEALQKYVGIMDEVAKKHLSAHWDHKKEVNVFPLAKNYTFGVASR